MKRYVRESSKVTPVDLSEEMSIGIRCLDELRKLYPDIPKRCRYRRFKAWSSCWYIRFYLELPVQELAKEYRNSVASDDSTDYKPYWEYINEFQDSCNEICHRPDFYNDFVQCSVCYFNDYDSGPSGAVLDVFALTKKTGNY